MSIGERYLVRRSAPRPGSEDELTITREALKRIVREYTREAGVRELDRQIGTIARKVALRLAEGGEGKTVVDAAQVPDYLGRPRFLDEVAERTDRPGVATGLAWTPVGGDILFVRDMMPSGKSARADRHARRGDAGGAQAAAVVRALEAARLGVAPARVRGEAVHIHVPTEHPEGRPSAGVTIATALVSLATGRSVRSDVAMTVEITLRARCCRSRIKERCWPHIASGCGP